MDPLDVKLIRRLHYLLMYGSVDARLKRVSPGEFRTGPLVQKGRNSSQLPIPDESVDLVLTDPPYGGNVQYGELSAFWLAWIYDELGVTIDQITALVGEILIHRKNKVNAKTYQTYYEGLRRVYTECFRVLKKGQQLIWHKPVPIL
jgi:adenine-specific DNA methylase